MQCNNSGPRRLHDFASTLGCEAMGVYNDREMLVSLMEYVCIAQCEWPRV